jgi:hypothetical protein
MRGAGDEIASAQVFGGHLAEPLHGVGEERDFIRLTDGEEFAPGLDDAGFVVGAHHGDDAGARVGHFGGEPFHVHHAVVRDGNGFHALAEIVARRIMHAGMFDGADPDFALRVEGLREVVHGHVVGFGGAAGPDDVGGMAAEVVRERSRASVRALLAARPKACGLEGLP